MLVVAGPSPGGLGFLIVVVFFIAAVLIFMAMTRSMRRMRSHVERGDFGGPDAPPDPDAFPPETTDPPRQDGRREPPGPPGTAGG
jgi:hypothetical protein